MNQTQTIDEAGMGYIFSEYIEKINEPNPNYS